MKLYQLALEVSANSLSTVPFVPDTFFKAGFLQGVSPTGTECARTKCVIKTKNWGCVPLALLVLE